VQERKLKKVKEEKVAHVAKPREAQQEWKRSLVEELRRRAKEHYGKEMPEEACLLELGWCMEKVIVMYVQCERCEEKGCHVEKNRRQGIIKDKQRWYGYQKKEKKVVCPTERKAQQSSAQPRESKSTAKEGGS